MVNARLSATIAARANVTHNTLGARSTAASAVGSRAKLKITRTRAAKTTADTSAVRLLSSARMSLAAIARASRTDSGTDQPVIAGQKRVEVALAPLVADPLAVRQHRHPGREPPHLAQA